MGFTFKILYIWGLNLYEVAYKSPSHLSKSKHQDPKYYFICSLEYIQMFDVYKAKKVKISFSCGIKCRLWVIVKTRNCQLDFLYLNEFQIFQQEDKNYELDDSQ